MREAASACWDAAHLALARVSAAASASSSKQACGGWKASARRPPRPPTPPAAACTGTTRTRRAAGTPASASRAPSRSWRTWSSGSSWCTPGLDATTRRIGSGRSCCSRGRTCTSAASSRTRVSLRALLSGSSCLRPRLLIVPGSAAPCLDCRSRNDPDANEIITS